MAGLTCSYNRDWMPRTALRKIDRKEFVTQNCFQPFEGSDRKKKKKVMEKSQWKWPALRIIGPSKLAILRTLPLLYRFKPFDWRVQDPQGVEISYKNRLWIWIFFSPPPKMPVFLGSRIPTVDLTFFACFFASFKKGIFFDANHHTL